MKAEFKKPENRDRKYFLLKHHYWMNFEEFNVTQPTFINVIREPTSWFTSRYYFQRYGWNRNVDSRRNGFFKELKSSKSNHKILNRFSSYLSKEDQNRSIDECILEGYDECTSVRQVLNSKLTPI